MDVVTKNIDKVILNRQEITVDDMIRCEIDHRIKECISLLDREVKVCAAAIDNVKKDGWIQIKNRDVYYKSMNSAKQHILLPDTKRRKVKIYGEIKASDKDEVSKEVSNGFRVIDGEKARLMTSKEVNDLFASNKYNPLVGDEIRYISFYREEKCRVVFNEGTHSCRFILCTNSANDIIAFDLYDSTLCEVDEVYAEAAIYLPVIIDKKIKSTVGFFLQNGLIPDGISEDAEKSFRRLFVLKTEGAIKVDPVIEFTIEYLSRIREKNVEKVLGVSFKDDDIISFIRRSNNIDMTSIVKRYLYCDKIRADIEPYDEGQVYEVNRGHWELWSVPKNDEKNEEKISVKLTKSMVARNPVADVNKKGVVGIDFGTKSTVVVLLDERSQIHQMRIGSGNLKKDVRKSDYENPTVMEFRDIENFMKRYREKEGRPNTLWNDITISHSAIDSLNNAKNSQEYYSFFSDLKQWSDDSSRKIRIKDLKQHEEILKDFLEINDKSLNPIEIYAYYLGLAINNMRNGIYMDYILSYPVNYPVKVRNKIIECFERGLKKSLPEEVLQNKECMDLFRVQAGVSEPAAYAISALKGYGFAPQEGEKFFYGIFDFGGGTTDFDFGIWRGAEGKECRRADYVIEHFGAGGDRYLGGENLLELLAFDVFKENRKIMLEKDMTFFKPNERSAFSGSEMLLSTSQEARLNTRQLMEKLRSFWESDIVGAGEREKVSDKQNHSAVSSAASKAGAGNHRTDINDNSDLNAIKEGIIKVSLFDKKGNIQPNVELKVNAEELEKILTDRIRIGVVNFFEAVKNIFDQPEVADVKKINIFLAGNSCKSPIVRKLFKEIIEQKSKEIEDFYKKKGQALNSDSLFEIYPALGTPEAEKKRKELGLTESKEQAEYEKPTGKTGVAYGLIEGRNGSRIKVVSEIGSTDETKFKFYIGYEKRGKFHVEIERDIEYKTWVEFVDAAESDFELLYTSLPEATTNQMDITRVKRMPCRIKNSYNDESINVYIQATEPDILEYVVGKYDDVQNGKYLEGPYKIKLEE